MGHDLIRLSPKGKDQKYVGFCPKCGKTGLTLSDITQHCENINNMSFEDSLIRAIEGDADWLAS